MPFYSLKYKLSCKVCFKKIGMAQRGENWGWIKVSGQRVRILENGKKFVISVFNWFNFALMACSQFPSRNVLKLEFVLFEAERDNDAEGISWLSQLQKGQILFLGHF